jgi:NADH:ubiquinone oxidoreductase subunit K
MLSLFRLAQCIPLIILITFIQQQNHLLMALLALEGITLSLVLSIPLTMTINLIPASASCIIILSIGACEASLGLALIVAAARTTGNDILRTLSINKC